MAKKDVLPFASVDAYLRRKGFTCYRVRDYDEPRGARRYYYECPNRKMPRMTFPRRAAGSWRITLKKSRRQSVFTKRATRPKGSAPRSVLQRAKHQAAQYKFIIEPHPRVGFVGRVVEMPGVLADGPTAADCLSDLTMALETTLADMIKAGESLPSPKSPGQRREQINIRLTAAEKADLVEECMRRGFKGLSDFVRNAALEACG